MIVEWEKEGEGWRREMINNEKFYGKLYEILATLQYNTERGELVEEILRSFLVNRDYKLDIPSKAKEISEEKKTSPTGFRTIKNSAESLKSEWFKQECLLLSNIPHQYIPEYIIPKFSPFSKEFENLFGFDMNALWLFSFKLMEYIEIKKNMVHFADEVYKFKSKKEYADLGFVVTPSGLFIKEWQNVVTITISEFKRLLSGILSFHESSEVLKMLSIDIEHLPKDPENIRFPATPLFKVDENTLIIFTPTYLTRALPSIYEGLFNNIRKYRESKGNPFEKLVQKTLKSLPFKTLTFNVRYGNNFEVDSIIEFKKSVWFVEITSHPPNVNSLKGNLVSIKRDLEKTTEKCLNPGKRCFQHLNTVPLSCFFKDEKTKGILIVVDGVYPQLNMNTAIEFFEEKIPVYLINWFDLRILIDQPEIEKFEDFLLWRTQQPMPVICFDEKDYWAFYFDSHIPNKKEMKKALKTMKEKGIKFFYISYRFNNKSYLEKISSD